MKKNPLTDTCKNKDKMKQNVWYVCNVHITHIYTQRKLHGLTVWRENEIRASHNIMKMIITATISSLLIPLVWREKKSNACTHTRKVEI